MPNPGTDSRVCICQSIVEGGFVCCAEARLSTRTPRKVFRFDQMLCRLLLRSCTPAGRIVSEPVSVRFETKFQDSLSRYCRHLGYARPSRCPDPAHYGFRYGFAPATGNLQQLGGRPPRVSPLKSCVGSSFTTATMGRIAIGVVRTALLQLAKPLTWESREFEIRTPANTIDSELLSKKNTRRTKVTGSFTCSWPCLR
jgi:hypothetical protein